MEAYVHKVQYYETDQMGVVHHSNYIRWFEEARIDYLDKMGMSYDAVEKKGIISPVVSLNCEYKSPARFGDTVFIVTCLKMVSGVKFCFGYEVYDLKSREIRATGESRHCFLKDNKIISIKKENEDVYELFKSYEGVSTTIEGIY
jgi:acyl-CoA thioester hydrolase